MRQEAYRVAFEEANWELKDIVGQFDALSARKEQVERVVDVLKPFVSFAAQATVPEPKVGESLTESSPRESRGFYSPQVRGMRQEAYRVAFEEANVELKEFILKFEQLRFRKEQIERLVDVLKPLIGQSGPLAVMEPSSISSEAGVLSEAAPEAATQSQVPALEAAQPAEENVDPFQRRGDSPAAVSAGSKDLRDYSRLFSSSLHRR